MKKIIALSVAALMFSAPYVMADDAGGNDSQQRHAYGEKMFQQHDIDGDGYISKEEFLASAEKKFKEMDLDGDGEISKDEAKKHRAEMKDKMKKRQEKRKERRENKSDD